MAASTARNNKTAIGAAHRRRLARMDSAKAVKSTAHQLARLMYAMPTNVQDAAKRPGDLAAGSESAGRDYAHAQRRPIPTHGPRPSDIRA